MSHARASGWHGKCNCSAAPLNVPQLTERCALQLLYWDVATGRALAQSQQDQKWDTWTTKVGFDVLGIWQEGDDGSDINSVCRDPSSTLVAAADDSGSVRLFAYPCVTPQSVCERHLGHASHVMQVCLAAWSCQVLVDRVELLG